MTCVGLLHRVLLLTWGKESRPRAPLCCALVEFRPRSSEKRLTDMYAHINAPSALVRSAPQNLKRAQVSRLCRLCLPWTPTSPNVILNQALPHCFVHESSCLIPLQPSRPPRWSIYDILTRVFFTACRAELSAALRFFSCGVINGGAQLERLSTEYKKYKVPPHLQIFFSMSNVWC